MVIPSRDDVNGPLIVRVPEGSDQKFLQLLRPCTLYPSPQPLGVMIGDQTLVVYVEREVLRH